MGAGLDPFPACPDRSRGGVLIELPRCGHATGRAIALHGEGRSYDDIAEQLRYTNRGSARKAVDRSLRVQRDLRADEYLQTQIDRYEKVLATWWERATTGQTEGAASVVLRALERLDRVPRLTEGEQGVSQETVVIAADPEAYVAQLRQVVRERDREP